MVVFPKGNNRDRTAWAMTNWIGPAFSDVNLQLRLIYGAADIDAVLKGVRLCYDLYGRVGNSQPAICTSNFNVIKSQKPGYLVVEMSTPKQQLNCDLFRVISGALDVSFRPFFSYKFSSHCQCVEKKMLKCFLTDSLSRQRLCSAMNKSRIKSVVASAARRRCHVLYLYHHIHRSHRVTPHSATLKVIFTAPITPPTISGHECIREKSACTPNWNNKKCHEKNRIWCPYITECHERSCYHRVEELPTRTSLCFLNTTRFFRFQPTQACSSTYQRRDTMSLGGTSH